MTRQVSGPPVGPGDLILAGGTLRPLPFEDRVRVAAEAGFAGVGVNFGAWSQFVARGGTPEVAARLCEDNGVQLAEIEAYSGFAATGMSTATAFPPRQYASRENEAIAFALADACGARHLQATGAFEGELEPDVVAAFAGLCDRAGEHGLLVALEFIPASNIPNAATALRIVTEAGRSNGGLCVDSWHCFRGTTTPADLRALPADKVLLIQLDDGPARPVDNDFLHDTIHHRRLPGEGEFDLRGFLDALATAGVRAPISVEILSDEMDQLPQTEVATRIATATRRLLA